MLLLCIILGFIFVVLTKNALLGGIIAALLFILIKVLQHSYIVHALKERYNLLIQTGILELDPITEKYLHIYTLQEKYLQKMESKLWWEKPVVYQAYEGLSKKSYFSGYGDIFSNCFQHLVDTYPLFSSIHRNQEFYYLLAKYKSSDYKNYLIKKIFLGEERIGEYTVMHKILTEQLVEITDRTDKAIYDKMVIKYAPKTQDVVSEESEEDKNIQTKQDSQSFYAKRLNIKPEEIVEEVQVEEITIEKVSEKYL